MSTFNTIYDGIYNYCAGIPKNTPTQALIAFGSATLFKTILSGKPKLGVLAGVTSAIATLIYGLVTPLFKYLNGGPTLSWKGEMGRTFTGIIVAGLIAKAFGNSSILYKIVGAAFDIGFLIHLVPKRRELSRANWVWIFPEFILEN